METVPPKNAQNAEDRRAADGSDHELLPLTSAPPPLASSSSTPNPSHHSFHVSSASYLGRQMECWICFDTRTSRANPIVTHRCRCRGSVGFVHQKCIDRWVIEQHNRVCRSCGAVYRLVHSDYPPGAYLPLDAKGRRAFLIKFLAKPLLKEVAEALACVLLRFLGVPFILGIIYNFHRLPVLMWIYPGSTTLSKVLAVNWFDSPRVLWLLNMDAAAAAHAEMSYTVCLAAWADTLLFGFVLCAVMDAVVVAYRKWNKYFKNARRQHEREIAVAAAVAAGGDDGELEDLLRGAAAAEQLARAGGIAEAMERVRQPRLFFHEPVVEGWRPEWGPMPVDTDFEPDARQNAFAPQNDWRDFEGPDAEGASEDLSDDGGSGGGDDGGAARELENAADDDSDVASTTTTSDSDDDDASSGDAPPRLSFVDEMFDMVDRVRSGPGGGGLRRLLRSIKAQSWHGVALTLLLRCPLGRMVIAAACVFFVVGWRYRYSRNVLTTPKRRFEEVAERVPLLAPEAVRALFYVYLVDAFFFYCALPEMGGMMLHCALSPYLDIGMNGGLLAFFSGLTVWKLTVYWGIGALLVMLLTAMELTVVSALFANGVELFFVRSFDARWDSVLGYWRCVITQVFDTDPLRIVYGFARVAVVELLVLLVFVRLPFWGMFGVRDLVWGDGTLVAVPESPALLSTAEPSKLAFSLGVDSGYEFEQDFTFSEWRRAEALQLLDEKVLMPFGAIYAEMIGSHPSFLGENVAMPNRMDPLAAAATLVTNTTPAEMWAQVWGNMSDTAVFTFDLLDPTSAAHVAELSEGFRDTLARVRAPLAWLRQATLRASVCDTLTALSAPADLNQDATERLPAVDVEDLVRPPNVALADPYASAVRNRQLIFEAWQRAHYPTVQHLRLFARGQYKGGQPRSSQMHTVNTVNCYVTFLRVTQPFVRMGHWHTAVMEWWSMLLVQNVYINYGLLLSFYMVAFFTAVACFGVFPLQRAQLRLLLPFVQWVGRRVVHMEDYLFDPDQTRAVEDFVRTEVDDELVLPPMAEQLGFNRREDYIDDHLIPSHVVLRRVVVSVLFFVAASLMVWTVPVLCGSLLLSFTSNALPVLLGATLLSFFIWSPSLLGRSVLFGVALSLAFFFALPLFFMVYILPTLQTFWKCYPALVEETFQRQYNVQQMVGPFNENEAGGYNDGSSGWSTEEDEDYARGAAAEVEEWESVDSDEADEAERAEPPQEQENEEEERNEEEGQH